MANVRGSASQTVVAILSTVNSAAGMVLKTVDSAASSVDMLDTYVQRAKVKQMEDNLAEDLHRRRNLVLDSCREQQKKEASVIKAYANDPTGAAMLNALIEKMEAAFETLDASRK